MLFVFGYSIYRADRGGPHRDGASVGLDNLRIRFTTRFSGCGRP